jgi:hypothetical protein
LEDEAVSIQELEGWSREKEIPQRCGGICPGVSAANVSSAPQSKQGVEKVEDGD